jgi:signal transduction histidine kinase
MRLDGIELPEEIMSHEVRSSIMCIIGAKELLDAAYKEQHKQEILIKEYINIIIRNTRRFERAIKTERGLLLHRVNI